MCNGEQWSAVLDKYHRRKVHEVCVRCWHKDNGCGWVGEMNGLKRHADSCELRPWECKYCGLKCTYGEGEGKHWPTCHKFPEPCPNSCEVVSVERCNIEQHRSVCPLEPVACEMKEFGCSVVVPRKELATHMKESELQHLTAMTIGSVRFVNTDFWIFRNIAAARLFTSPFVIRDGSSNWVSNSIRSSSLISLKALLATLLNCPGFRLNASFPAV